MVFDRRSSDGGRRDDGRGGWHAPTPGKHTLTESLAPVAQPRTQAPPLAAPVSSGGGAASGIESANTTSEADMIQEGTTGGGEHGAAQAGGQQAGGQQAGGQQAGGQQAGGQATAGGKAGGAGPSAAPAEAGPLPVAAAADASAGGTAAGGNTAGAGAGAGPVAAPTTLYIMGPRELWFFDSQTPAGYEVSRQLHSNRTGGTFRWSASANLTISAPGGATPTVTSAAASTGRRDGWIRLSHTDAAGATTVASYRVTILAPDSLRHLRDDDQPDPTWVYSSFIHYSVLDQFGTVLPRNVPLNEQFTAAPVADFAGMDWGRGPQGGATVNPADWFDHVGGETPGHTPAPVAPGSAGAGTAVYHWPGIWRVGSTAIGVGRTVATVTWQKHRGFARHV